ncbi:hypothetical protein XH80_25165 [Bradyrhizobium sp. CCBAU 45384]|nr:hypothetical protein [Bradyrhizobium sp. CCBAU 45384]
MGSIAPPPAAQCSPPIVFACDGAYAMQLATTLRSVTEANQGWWPLNIHVLVDDFPNDARTRVLASIPEGSASLRWITVDLEPFWKFSPGEFISWMIFARLLIPVLFPETVNRVLYLDADLLVLDDLGPLWDADLEGAAAGAVLDALDPLLKIGGPGLEQLPTVRNYFNSGVLLIDLARWRQEQISERAIEYLTGHPHSLFPDQDALNVACDGLWKALDTRWNFQNHYETRIADMSSADQPAIVHFVTRGKPWKASSLSVNASLYDAFRSRTCFARTRPARLYDAVQTAWGRIKRHVRKLASASLTGLIRAFWVRTRAKPEDEPGE